MIAIQTKHALFTKPYKIYLYNFFFVILEKEKKSRENGNSNQRETPNANSIFRDGKSNMRENSHGYMASICAIF